MDIDPVTTAGLVTREVRSGSRDGAPTKIVVARRTYGTDRADLWEAVTDAERLPRWFLPISGDLRVGGRFQLEGNAGGLVERCDEPESFAVMWEFDGNVSWLAVTLTPDGDATTFDSPSPPRAPNSCSVRRPGGATPRSATAPSDAFSPPGCRRRT